MPRMSVQFEDGANLSGKLDALRREDLNDVVAATVNEIARDAKAVTPTQTHALVNSIRAEVKGGTGTVGYTAEYAPHVEYGHRQNVGKYVPTLGKRLKAPYVQGQHFFRPVVERGKANFRRRVEEAIGGDMA